MKEEKSPQQQPQVVYVVVQPQHQQPPPQTIVVVNPQMQLVPVHAEAPPIDTGAEGQTGEWTETNVDELPPDYEAVIQAETDGAKDGVGCGQSCASHTKSWIFTGIVWIIIFTIVLVTITQDNLLAIFVLIPMCVICWCCYSFEWVCSSSRQYLSNIYGKEFVYQDAQRLRNECPTIKWDVECYHYRHTRDSRGRTRRTKVVTHRASTNYVFNSWRDVSADLVGLEEWKLTKLTVYKRFVFANEMTRNDYTSKMQAFKMANNRDTHQNFRTEMVLNDFKGKILVECAPGQRSRMISQEANILTSCLLCSPCYRTWFGAQTGKKHYLIDKEISL